MHTHTHTLYTGVCVCVHLRMGSWKLIEKLPRRSKLGEPKSQKRNHIFCTLTQFSAPPPSPQDLTPFADFLLFADPFRHTKLIIFDATHNNNGNPGQAPASVCVCGCSYLICIDAFGSCMFYGEDAQVISIAPACP